MEGKKQKTARARRAARARQAVIEKPIERGGTPETRAKARYDVVQGLSQAGKLSPGEMGAAEEILRVHEALGASIFPARELDISLRGVGGHFTPINWLDRMKPGDYRAWLSHYLPWCQAMESVRMISSPRVNIVAVVVHAVVDNWNLNQCDRAYRFRHGESMRLLHAGLTSYAKIAGF